MGAHATLLPLYNGESAPVSEEPVLAPVAFRQAILDTVAEGGRVAALYGRTDPRGGLLLRAVLACEDGTLRLGSAPAPATWTSLTPECPQLHLFEREIAETWGAAPQGHPWLKPVRYLRSPIGQAPWYVVEGDAVHEVAVGPVHAGVIEPGHFRFQCQGEDVLHLEISLGYQHRGVERALTAGPDRRSLHYAETLAGDTSVGHAWAWCQAVEALAGCTVPPRAQAIRGIALELERLANHVGDLGALAADVGYLPTSAYCGRLRGDYLNLSALLCGNRFGRGLVRPGGTGFDLEPERANRALERLERAWKDTTRAVGLLWNTSSVRARFEGTGAIRREDCVALGLVGPAARACGLTRDVRYEFPWGAYGFAQIPVALAESGDVFGRAYVRWLEAQRSVEFLREQLGALPDGSVRADPGAPRPGRVAVSLVEGWRGEICHVVETGADGRYASCKVVDPSFHNWAGLALALRGQQISDFPLCNKSFNLSYCGHDL